MYLKISEAERKKILKTLYVSTAGVVRLPNDLYKDIMLITCSCGRGKTTYALKTDGLLADINFIRKNDLQFFLKHQQEIKPCEMLFLTARKAIKDQLSNTDLDIKLAAVEDFNCLFSQEDEDKIRYATAHQFAAWIEQGLIDRPPKVIILDEIHTIFCETSFADVLNQIIEFLKENYNDVIKVGLTATPQILFDYVEPYDDKLSFTTISKELGSKYTVDKINVLRFGKLDTFLKEKIKQAGKDNKLLIYTQSAKECYLLSKKYAGMGYKTGFIISDYNKRMIEDKRLVDIMKQQIVEWKDEKGIPVEQELKEYILENEKLPSSCDVLFINSAWREGVNIKDAAVQTVICEAVDMITVEQILGRIRGDLREFIVISNLRSESITMKNINDFSELLSAIEKMSTDADRQILLKREYQNYFKDGEKKDCNKYVYVYKGVYKINKYAKMYLQYMNESYIQLKNQKKKAVVSVADRELKRDYEEYYKCLERFSDNPIEIKNIRETVIKQNHENAIERFKSIESSWTDRPLTTADKKELCGQLAAIRENGKKASWKTVKEMLIDNGYTVADKRTSTARVSVISKQ